MKRKPEGEEKLSFELKYCERCGGLWLRPMGGAQIYCSGCARQIAEMPPASHRLDASLAHQEEGYGAISDLEELLSDEELQDIAGEEA
ncbi:MAG: hypothetical protein ABR874_08800 [Candidatus Sulfotelmatobacter sp.]|jgi:Zn-finger nucleic acid-binding protein